MARRRISVNSAALRKSRDKGRPRKTSRLRIVFWVVQIAAALAFLEHFVLRPFLTRDLPETPAPAPEFAPPPPGEAVPVAGESALRIPHMAEQAQARLANVSTLADGSAVALAAQVQTARDLSLPIELMNSVGMRFRLVPPGTYLMGSGEDDPNRWEGEAQHVAKAPSPFYAGKYEVTQAQWEVVMGSNPSHFRGPNRPVEEVTWYDCQRFTVALCKKEDLPLGTYRLPTEAEWEYMCRAGTDTPYYFGTDPRQLRWYAVFKWNSDGGTAPVGGGRLPNAYGLHGLHGNVWEWCLDKFLLYETGEPEKGMEYARCIRGGNWYLEPGDCRAADRCRLGPDSKGNMLGFRVIRTIPELFTLLPAE